MTCCPYCGREFDEERLVDAMMARDVHEITVRCRGCEALLEIQAELALVVEPIEVH